MDCYVLIKISIVLIKFKFKVKNLPLKAVKIYISLYTTNFFLVYQLKIFLTKNFFDSCNDNSSSQKSLTTLKVQNWVKQQELEYFEIFG